MLDNTLETHWPVRTARENDWYFYLEAIEEYLPGNRVKVAGHPDMLMLGGYSYLGLNGHPAIKDATHRAVEKYGTGSHGARLMAGTLNLHQQLEEKIASFKRTEAAAVFSSGFFANVSTIASLVGRHDTVICDKLDHASIVDGCMLAGAKFVRFRHNDASHLESCLKDPDNPGRVLVIVDAVYSMDGDIVDLPEVSRLCRRYGASLMVDEAHAIGVLGRTGHGIEEHFDLGPDSVDIKMGTLSKAIPSVGGYVAGSRKLCDYLQHQARGFIYSGSLPPPATAAALEALEVIEREPERVRRLHENTAYFDAALRKHGLDSSSQTPIFPIPCGENETAWKFARYCQKRGVYIQAIPHPVVPQGRARLRAAVMATHSIEDLDFCASVLAEGAQAIGLASDSGRKDRSETFDERLSEIPAPAGVVSLFSNIAEEQMQRFRQVTTVVGFKAGETVVRQGDEGQEMYLILKGLADVQKEVDGRSYHLDTLAEGAIFGEMGFATGQPRTASVIAVTPLELLVLSQQSIRRLAVTVPDVVVQLLLNLSNILSHRLQSTTEEWLTALKVGGMNAIVDAP